MSCSASSKLHLPSHPPWLLVPKASPVRCTGLDLLHFQSQDSIHPPMLSKGDWEGPHFHPCQAFPTPLFLNLSSVSIPSHCPLLGSASLLSFPGSPPHPPLCSSLHCSISSSPFTPATHQLAFLQSPQRALAKLGIHQTFTLCQKSSSPSPSGPDPQPPSLVSLLVWWVCRMTIPHILSISSNFYLWPPQHTHTHTNIHSSSALIKPPRK